MHLTASLTTANVSLLLIAWPSTPACQSWHIYQLHTPPIFANILIRTRLYCGCEDFVEIFDVQRPGDGERFPTIATKKSKDGVKGPHAQPHSHLGVCSSDVFFQCLGIISSISFCPDYSGLYAVGTYTSTSSCIALFDQSSAAGAPITFLEGLRQGGVTQLQFHPTQPHILFASSRRNAFVQRWDLRNPSEPLGQDFVRDSESKGTNQRLRFDIDLGGQCLAAGSEVCVAHRR